MEQTTFSQNKLEFQIQNKTQIVYKKPKSW